MTDSTHGPDPEPAPPAAPKRQARWPLIAGVIAIGVLVLGAIAWAVAAPDREACKSALGREIDAMLASNQPIENWEDDPKLQARIKAKVTWACRFQSESDLESIAGEIIMARLPQILARSFDEAFGNPEPTPEPTASPTPEWTTSKNDWNASLKIVSKQCYGYGLGCSVDAKVKLDYDGDSSSIPEDATIEVTYEIKGAKDGPVVGSTGVTNQTEYDVNTEYLETRSRSSKLTVVVTSVEVY
jgi:hypothetical protein